MAETQTTQLQASHLASPIFFPAGVLELGLCCPKPPAMVMPKFQNPRLTWLGRNLKAHLFPPLAMGRYTFHYPRFPQALSNQALDTFRDKVFFKRHELRFPSWSLCPATTPKMKELFQILLLFPVLRISLLVFPRLPGLSPCKDHSPSSPLRAGHSTSVFPLLLLPWVQNLSGCKPVK